VLALGSLTETQMRQFITLPMVIALIGALCSALAAFWTTAMQAQERAQAAEARAQAEKDLREKSDVIAQKSDVIADLHRQSAEARAKAEEECVRSLTRLRVSTNEWLIW
jgi:hypothetical protein